MTESDSGCSGKKLPQTRKNNNVELDRVTEEAESNSSINSDLSALDRVPKQASVKKKMTTETNLEAIMSDCHEAEIETDENVTLEFDKENHDPEISQQEIKENPEKRMKMESKKMLELKTQDKKASAVIERCQYCKQKLNNDIKLYQGHPNGAVEEEIALTDPKLCLFIGDESFIDESDERPQNKLTHFR